MKSFKQFVKLSKLFEALSEKEKKDVDTWNRGDYGFSDHAFPSPEDMRTYLPLQDMQINSPHQKAVEKKLKQLGFELDDYMAGTAKDKHGRTISIGKVLNKANDIRLLDRYNNDPARQQSSAGDDLHVVISRHPYDVAGMTSSGQSWVNQSCMNFNTGSNRHYLKNDIKHGTHVAYLVNKKDKDLEHPLARIALKPYEPETDEDVSPNDKILRPEERTYGDAPESFTNVVNRWANKNFPGNSDAVYRKHKDVYNDSGNMEIIPSAAFNRILNDETNQNDDYNVERVLRSPAFGDEHVDAVLRRLSNSDVKLEPFSGTYNQSFKILNQLASNRNLGEESLDKIYSLYETNYKGTDNVLERTPNDSYRHKEFINTIAANPSLSDNLVSTLIGTTYNRHSDDLSSDKNTNYKTLRNLVGTNPNLSEETIRNLYAHPLMNPDNLNFDNAENKLQLSRKLFEHENMPEDIMREAHNKYDARPTHDAERNVIFNAIANNKYIPRDLVEKMMDDKDHEVLKKIASNQKLSKEQIDSLVEKSKEDGLIARGLVDNKKLSKTNIRDLLDNHPESDIVVETLAKHPKFDSSHIQHMANAYKENLNNAVQAFRTQQTDGKEKERSKRHATASLKGLQKIIDISADRSSMDGAAMDSVVDALNPKNNNGIDEIDNGFGANLKLYHDYANKAILQSTNPNVTDSHINDILNSSIVGRDVNLIHGLAVRHPNISSDTLSNVINGNFSDSIKQSALLNPSITKNMLRDTIRNGNDNLVATALRSKNIDSSHLMAVLDSSKSYSHADIFSRPEHINRDIIDKIMSNQYQYPAEKLHLYRKLHNLSMEPIPRNDRTVINAGVELNPDDIKRIHDEVTSPEFKNSMTDFDSPEELRNLMVTIARHHNTSPDLLNKIFNDNIDDNQNNRSMQRLILRNDNVSEETLNTAIYKGQPNERIEALMNPKVPAKTLLDVATSGKFKDGDTPYYAMKHPNFPPEGVDMMINHPKDGVQHRRGILDMLSRTSSKISALKPEHIDSIIDKIDNSEDALKLFAASGGFNDNVTSSHLKKLIQKPIEYTDDDARKIGSLIRNSENTDDSVVDALMNADHLQQAKGRVVGRGSMLKQKHIDDIMNGNDDDLKEAVLTNDNYVDKIKPEHIGRILQTVPAEENSFTTRLHGYAGVLLAKSLDPKYAAQVDAATKHPSAAVRNIVTSSPLLTPKHIKKLLDDDAQSVRNDMFSNITTTLNQRTKQRDDLISYGIDRVNSNHASSHAGRLEFTPNHVRQVMSKIDDKDPEKLGTILRMTNSVKFDKGNVDDVLRTTKKYEENVKQSDNDNVAEYVHNQLLSHSWLEHEVTADHLHNITDRMLKNREHLKSKGALKNTVFAQNLESGIVSHINNGNPVHDKTLHALIHHPTVNIENKDSLARERNPHSENVLHVAMNSDNPDVAEWGLEHGSRRKDSDQYIDMARNSKHQRLREIGDSLASERTRLASERTNEN